MSTTTNTRPFTIDDFEDIIRIANKRLGEGYITTDELNAYVSVKDKIGIVATSNSKIVGFALAHICNRTEAILLILKEHDWFAKQFTNKDSIGILKTIAVDSAFSNQGIGTLLTRHRIEIIKKKTTSILAISWEHKKNLANTKMLEHFGLSLKRKIKNYWKKDSLLKTYTCETCGTPPCKCSALIYIY